MQVSSECFFKKVIGANYDIMWGAVLFILFVLH